MNRCLVISLLLVSSLSWSQRLGLNELHWGMSEDAIETWYREPPTERQIDGERVFLRYNDRVYSHDAIVTYYFVPPNGLQYMHIYFKLDWNSRRDVRLSLEQNYMLEDYGYPEIWLRGPGVRVYGWYEEWDTYVEMAVILFRTLALNEDEEMLSSQQLLELRYEPLPSAVRSGSVADVKRLLSAGLKPNERDSEGWLPLTWSVWERKMEVLRLLIDSGANPDALNGDGSTTLHWAVCTGNADAARIILKSGAAIDIANEHVQTPLVNAIFARRPELIQLLISEGANADLENRGFTPLQMAAQEPCTSCVRILVESGADIDAQVTAEEGEGMTALMLAANTGQIENLRFLIESGADPSIQDAKGMMAIDHAKDDAIIELLKRAK